MTSEFATVRALGELSEDLRADAFEVAALRLAVAQALKLLRRNEVAKAEMVLREVSK